MPATRAEPPSQALGYRNYRLYFGGQLLSNVGTWFQVLAEGLLVLELTGKASALGLTAALQFLPVLLFSAWAGVLLDRLNVRRVIIVTAGLAAAQSLTLGILTATGHVTYGWVLSLAFLMGCFQMFDRPSAQALLPELVAPNAIASAVSTNTILVSIARLAGPAIGGLLYAWKGPQLCFFGNAVSFLFVMAAMLAMRTRDLYPRKQRQRDRGQIREGFRYVWGHPGMRRLIVANAVIGLFAFNFLTTIPAMVTFVFDQGSGVVGASHAINATCSVLGGLVLARYFHRATMRGFELACVLLATAFTVQALAPTLAVYLASMTILGVAFVVYQTSSQTYIQQNTRPEFLGRVMSLYFLGVQGTTPIGALLTGWLTDAVSARAAVAVGAVAIVCVLAGLVLSRPSRDEVPARPDVRPEPIMAVAAVDPVSGSDVDAEATFP
jgi:MFS family permease